MTEQVYPWQAPFVCSFQAIEPERHGDIDVYAARQLPAPTVVFLHGGPVPPGIPVTPRDWPVYRGYASLTVGLGLTALTVDHALHAIDDYPAVYEQVLQAIDAARSHGAVDADRIAVWAFSGGAPLTAPLLADPPDWLRCVALTYPIVDSTARATLPDGHHPIDALHAGAPPVVLTRVGRESAPIASGVDAFVHRANELGARLTTIDVPDGQHGFDALPAVAGARDAVHTALETVHAALTG